MTDKGKATQRGRQARGIIDPYNIERPGVANPRRDWESGADLTPDEFVRVEQGPPKRINKITLPAIGRTAKNAKN
jgi:hypothetical protein